MSGAVSLSGEGVSLVPGATGGGGSGATGPAGPTGPTGGALTVTGAEGGSGSVTPVTNLTFYGVDVTGTTPSGIVNMTTITGAAATGTAQGVSVKLAGGAAGTAYGGGYVTLYGGSAEAGAYGGPGGNIFAQAGYGYGTARGGSLDFSAGDVVGANGSASGGGVYLGAGAGGALGGAGGNIFFIGGAGGADGGAGGGIKFTAGNAYATGVPGFVEFYLGTNGTTGVSADLRINNDPSMLSATHAWEAGDQLGGATGMTIFTSTRAMRITTIIGRPDAANGTAATLVVVKCASGTAPSGGIALTSDTMDLTGTAATNQTLTLSATLSDIILAPGDSLCIITTGTLALSAGCITIWGSLQ